MTRILHRRGVGVPKADAFEDVGEILIDIRSGIAYTLNNAGEVVALGNSEGSSGSGMIISPDEPQDVPTGTQWLDSTTADIWLWDEDKWLQWPAPAPKPPVYIGTDEPGGAVPGDLWYDPSNGSLNLFDGNTWVNIGAQGVTYTLPIVTRDGEIELPVTADGKNLAVALRGGTEAELPLSGSKLNVNTRGGPVELPLMAA